MKRRAFIAGARKHRSVAVDPSEVRQLPLPSSSASAHVGMPAD